MGLGLCCEEAARIILSSDEPFELVPTDEDFAVCLDDQEKEMFDEREELFSIIRDRSVSVFERMERIASKYSFELQDLFPEKLKDLYLSLERLCEKWTDLLLSIARFDPKSSILSDKEYSICFEQLLCYLIFRHFADGMYDERYIARIKFALSGVFLVASLCDGIDDANAFDILLFTEVGSEGLDYQFCNMMINYDLPWNPMRIEQRIGRIDRRGQISEFVNIYNLITSGTVDADIYTRCLLRIGVFEKSIGECEEILGEIGRQVERIAQIGAQLCCDLIHILRVFAICGILFHSVWRLKTQIHIFSCFFF